eukprot:CAMPEP_0181353942 /NCGR_PEP_ID=MMETSP1106-20121128/3096_1 /TAXON_ID=81844 /ORGANISM="Mantoniella antarctica, Strain SL-175" /LENGTH=661 /DNA_ID=CAMNT_0023466571 /DNA_START=41 /DNA_END=2025 /DNA_ORIENTATION=+
MTSAALANISTVSMRTLSSPQSAASVSSRNTMGGACVATTTARLGEAVRCTRRAATVMVSHRSRSGEIATNRTATWSMGASRGGRATSAFALSAAVGRRTRTRASASAPKIANAAVTVDLDMAGDDAAAAGELGGDQLYPVGRQLEDGRLKHWKNAMPANDAIDKQILKLFVPAMLNFLIIPLVGAVDVFWIGRMGSALALAAQGAANQVFSSAFWIISFMPSVIAPVVAKAAASGDTEEVQRAVGEAVFVASFVGLIGMALLTGMQEKALSVVGVVAGSPTALEAAPYIGWRALTFVPAIISTVGFAAFRGTLDVTTPMKITMFAQLVNVVLDPLLIFGVGSIKAMGVAQAAAIATSASEVTSAALYVSAMLDKKIITVKSMFRVPSFKQIGNLMVGGAAVQLRSIAQNITFIAVMRSILTMDPTGTAAAAHTVSAQMFQLGVIAILALSTLAAILIPQRMNAVTSEGGLFEAKKLADRLIVWGLLLGVLLGSLQACSLPVLKFITPLEGVQEMARLPVLIGAVQTPLNGLVFVLEGIMQGHQAFLRLAGGMFVSTGLMLCALKVWGHSLEGVWFCFFVFNISRLGFGLRHHLVDGPLAPGKLRELAAAEAAAAGRDGGVGAATPVVAAVPVKEGLMSGLLGGKGKGKSDGNGWVTYKFD